MTGTADALNLVFSIPMASPGIVQGVLRAGVAGQAHQGILRGVDADPLVTTAAVLVCVGVATASFFLAVSAARRELGSPRAVHGSWWLR